MPGNPRTKNGYRRRQLRARIQAKGEPCAICGKPIDYSLTTYRDPKDGKVKRHPMSYELDEIIPVSLGGNPFDESNVRAVHRICNQRRGNKTEDVIKRAKKPNKRSRDW